MKDDKIDEALGVAALIQQLQTGKITGEELQALRAWLDANEHNKTVFNGIASLSHWENSLKAVESYDIDILTKRIFESAGLAEPTFAAQPQPHVYRLRGKLRKYRVGMAAAVIVCLIIMAWGSRYYILGRRTVALAINKNTLIIKPGSNKAMLTLGNGTTMVLSDTVGNIVTAPGNNQTALAKGGIIVYGKPAAQQQIAMTWNVITTPKGGKYEVVLSDGTHVFLNSASSLKFPVSFNSDTREVIVTGEAYFEVSHISHEKRPWPFLVKISRAGGDGGEVRVLGTHFDIMAYDDEKTIKATLVEGLISMRKANDSILLKQGQQSVWSEQTQRLEVKSADIEAETAWKNGRFLFRSTDIKTIMRQLARWYDIDVAYSGDLTNIRFAGNIQRKEDIRELIEILEADGRLRFNITGKKIIVSHLTEQGGSMK